MTDLNRFGTDFILDDDYDIVFDNNGDIMTTMDYENQKVLSGVNVPYTGYYSVLRSLYNLLMTDREEYPFDPPYGCGLQKILSSNITPEFLSNVRQVITEALEDDPKVQSVTSVVPEIVGGNMLFVKVSVKLVGDDTVSEMIFPEIVIP